MEIGTNTYTIQVSLNFQYIYIYIYIYTERERETERERDREREREDSKSATKDAIRHVQSIDTRLRVSDVPRSIVRLSIASDAFVAPA
jgi:hypothetical protein